MLANAGREVPRLCYCCPNLISCVTYHALATHLCYICYCYHILMFCNTSCSYHTCVLHMLACQPISVKGYVPKEDRSIQCECIYFHPKYNLVSRTVLSSISETKSSPAGFPQLPNEGVGCWTSVSLLLRSVHFMSWRSDKSEKEEKSKWMTPMQSKCPAPPTGSNF